MTGKYKRKSENDLQVRGTSRGGLEPFNKPLQIDGDDTLPQHFTDTVHDAISNYKTYSDIFSPTQFLEASNTNWTANLTGNSTDRSSAYSTVTYDDFDREASVVVQKLFDEIDSMLYEPRSDGKSPLFEECYTWSHTFPHLRIRGVQLVDGPELGYQVVETPYSRTFSSSVPASDTLSYQESATSDLSSLFVGGSSIKVLKYSGSTTSAYHSDMSHLEEETICSDGHYEDILAIDSDIQEDEHDRKVLSNARRTKRHSRYPPITPNACAKDDIIHSLFDFLWNVVADSIRILLQRYSEHFVITHPMAISTTEEDNNNGVVKLPDINSLPIVHSSSRFNLSSVLSRPTPSLVPQHPPDRDQLRKLLHISKMEMSERRDKTFIEEGVDSPLGIINQSPTAKKSFGPRNQSATKKMPSRSKLAPLNDRVRTPNVEDEVLRGQGIAAVGKRLSSPPVSSNRALPPIAQSDTHYSEHDPTPIPRSMKRFNRASSAAADKDSRPVVKEKLVLIPDTRPSTTHTIYPTEQIASIGFTGQQRSLTPMDRFSNKVYLNITGSSLIHPQLDEEGEGHYGQVAHHNQWAPGHVGYRRNKPLNSSFVR